MGGKKNIIEQLKEEVINFSQTDLLKIMESIIGFQLGNMKRVLRFLLNKRRYLP